MASARWFSNRNPPTGPQNPAAPAAVLVGDCDGPLLDNRVTSLSAQGLAQELVPITSLASGADDLPLVVTPGSTIQTGAFPSLLGDANGNPVDNRVTSLSAQGLAQELVPITSLANAGPDNLALVVTPGGTIEPAAFPATSGGQAQQLTADADTVGLWTFDRTLADTSGNGNNLTRLLGSADVYAPMCPGLWGAQFNLSTYYQTPISAVFQLAGAMTLQFIATTPELKPSTQRDMVNCRDVGNAGDILYWVFSNTTPTIRGQWTGAGPTPAIPVMLSMVPALITLTRNADSSAIEMYVNATQVVSLSAASPTPNPAAVVGIGARVVGNVTPFIGTMCSVRVKNVYSNAAQVIADYNASLGPVFGTV